jgi:hypothetical protein
VKRSLDIFGSFVGRRFSRDIKRTSSANFPFGGFFAEPSSGRPGRRTTTAFFRSLCIPGQTPEAWQKLAQPVRAGKKAPLTIFPFGGFFAEPSFFRPSWIPITVAGGRASDFSSAGVLLAHSNEGPALLTFRLALRVAASCPEPAKGSRDIKNRLSQTFLSLGRAACLSFVGRGFSRDIKNRLSQTFLSAAFSPSLSLVARAPRTFRPRVRCTAVERRNSRPTPSSDAISTRFWSKSRSYRKQTTKPPLPGSRIAHTATTPDTRSASR